MPQYIVVEQVCETCGEQNGHLTADCPDAISYTWPMWSHAVQWAFDRVALVMFMLGRLA